MTRQLILEKQDLTHLSWSKIRHSSGTAGSFLKSYSQLGGGKTYYKLSDYDTAKGVVGHECVNELIVDRLLSILGVEHLRYQLIHADVRINERVEETWLTASEDFKERGEDKIALDAYYDAEHGPGETPLEFCVRNGWGDYIYQMLAVDFLILNRDRHGANIEVLRNKRKKTIRLAPLFDHGLSFLCCCRRDEEAATFDVMAGLPTNAYIGSRSAKANLELIPRDKLPAFSPLRESDRELLLKSLDGVISKTMQEKIWEMIWKRWCFYEDFRHS